MVAAGDAPSEVLFRSRAKDTDLLIAVDNGLEIFRQYGMKPDIIVGDMDSVSEKLLEVYKEKAMIIKAPVEKNETDSALAIDEAAKRGAVRIFFLGAIGGRMDHFLSNLMLLKYAYNHNIFLTMEDDKQEISLHNGTFEIIGKKGQTISILPMNRQAEVTAEGLYYPLQKLLLTNEHPRGVSNIFMGKSAKISSDDFVFIIKIKK